MIKKFLKEGMSKSAIARKLGISRNNHNGILLSNPISKLSATT